MIKRYSRKELTKIWEEKNKYKIWLAIELTAAEGMETVSYTHLTLPTNREV